MLKPPLGFLTKLLVAIAGYIDDFFTCSLSFTKCAFNVKRCVKVLGYLEFIVHPEKSVFATAKCMEYLGFKIHSFV